MAINASMNWYIRAGGSATNGGGYDAAVSGATVNYADQDTAQVEFSAGNSNRLNTSGAGATTVTSDGTPFTSDMVGNVIRISGGTNFQTGYYVVITYNSSSSIVVDRTPTSGGAGSVGTGSLGGAFATPWGSLATSGPTITSPLAAGHTINVRGSGSDNPGSADYTATTFNAYADGSLAAGRIKWKGYNGRPRIDHNTQLINTCRHHSFYDFVFVRYGTGNANLAVINSPTATYPPCYFYNCKVDQAGYDAVGLQGAIINCEFTNSGSTAAGSYVAILMNATYNVCIGNRVTDWRGGGISFSNKGVCSRNIVNSCHGTTLAGISASFGGANDGGLIENNVVYGCVSDGLKITSADAVCQTTVVNNIFYGNGGYGINITVGTTALNDRTIGLIDYNGYGNNTSGNTTGYTVQGNDVSLSSDPFTDSSTGDFTLNNTSGGGADLKWVGFPVSIP